MQPHAWPPVARSWHRLPVVRPWDRRGSLILDPLGNSML